MLSLNLCLQQLLLDCKFGEIPTSGLLDMPPIVFFNQMYVCMYVFFVSGMKPIWTEVI